MWYLILILIEINCLFHHWCILSILLLYIAQNMAICWISVYFFLLYCNPKISGCSILDFRRKKVLVGGLKICKAWNLIDAFSPISFIHNFIVCQAFQLGDKGKVWNPCRYADIPGIWGEVNAQYAQPKISFPKGGRWKLLRHQGQCHSPESWVWRLSS